MSAVRCGDGSAGVCDAGGEDGGGRDVLKEDPGSVEGWFTFAAFPQWCRRQEKGGLRGERREGGAAPWKQEGKMMRRLFLEAADREDGGMRGEKEEVEVAQSARR